MRGCWAQLPWPLKQVPAASAPTPCSRKQPSKSPHRLGLQMGQSREALPGPAPASGAPQRTSTPKDREQPRGQVWGALRGPLCWVHRDGGPREPPQTAEVWPRPSPPPERRAVGWRERSRAEGSRPVGGPGSLSPSGLAYVRRAPHPCTPPPLLSSHDVAESLRDPIYGFSSLLIGICLPARIKHTGFPVCILNQHVSLFKPGLGEDKPEAAGSRPTGGPLRPPPLCSPSPLPGAQGEWSSHPGLTEDSGPRSLPPPSGREGGAAPYIIVLESDLVRVLLGSRSHSTTSSLPAWGWGCGRAQRLACVQINLAPGTQQSHKARWRRPAGLGPEAGRLHGVGRAGGRAPAVGAVSKLGGGPGLSRLKRRPPAAARTGQGSARGPAGARAVKHQCRCGCQMWHPGRRLPSTENHSPCVSSHTEHVLHQTPAGHPAVRLDSDTGWFVQTLWGEGSVPKDCPPLQPQVPGPQVTQSICPLWLQIKGSLDPLPRLNHLLESWTIKKAEH